MISVCVNVNGDPAVRRGCGKDWWPICLSARRDTLLLKTQLQQKLYPRCLRNGSKLHCNELKEFNQ